MKKILITVGVIIAVLVICILSLRSYAISQQETTKQLAEIIAKEVASQLTNRSVGATEVIRFNQGTSSPIVVTTSSLRLVATSTQRTNLVLMLEPGSCPIHLSMNRGIPAVASSSGYILTELNPLIIGPDNNYIGAITGITSGGTCRGTVYEAAGLKTF